MSNLSEKYKGKNENKPCLRTFRKNKEKSSGKAKQKLSMGKKVWVGTKAIANNENFILGLMHLLGKNQALNILWSFLGSF